MKGQNFLLGFLGGKKQEIKGKNPNPSSKLIKSKGQLMPTKLSKQQPVQQQQQQDNKSNTNISTTSKKPLKAKKTSSVVVAQIQKLQKQLQSTNQQLKQTQKKLDVDLFLKKQKQKRQQYGKDINKQFQIQRKKREQKLYKKYNRGGVDGQGQEQGQQQGVIDQKKNVKSAFPFQLIKVLQNSKKSISKSQSIKEGHDFRPQEMEDESRMMSYLQIVEEQKQLLFTLGSSTSSIKKLCENMLTVAYFPIQFSRPLLEPTQQYQNLINALVLMPQHLSQKYYHHRELGNNSLFMCRMFFNGLRRSVITSDLIETRQFAHYHVNLHSKMCDNKSYGPTLVEKCFRKVSSNLQLPQLCSSVYTLFGTDAEIIQISNRNYLKQNFEPILQFLLSLGQLVGFMNDGGHNTTIYQNRVYKLKEVRQVVSVKEEGLQSGRKKKPRDKKADQMKQEGQERLEKENKTLYHLQNPYKGLVLDSKGLNKFQLLQALQRFNKLILVRDYPKGWCCKRINLQILSLGPLSMTNNEWTKNNQYSFQLTSELNLRVVMRRQSVSSSQSIISTKQTFSRQQELQANSIYGFMIFSCKQGEEKITCMKLDSLVTKTKSSNDSLQYPSFTEKLQRGAYILIPYSNKMTLKSYQFFNLDFFVEKSETINFGKAIINDWKWVKNAGNAQTSQKVIQSLQSREYIQRTKVQQIQINKIAKQGFYSEKRLKQLQSKNLVISKGLKLSDILIPGKLTRFLINPQVQVSKKAQRQGDKKSKKGAPGINKGNKIVLTTSKDDQIQSLQKQQALQILLGYDILQGQEINRGLMLQQMQNNQQVLDFEHYGLGSDGLTAIMQTLMTQCPSIRKLNLAGNQLDDSAIVFLCYYMQKGNRVELNELNVRDNKFGKIGMDAIKGLMARFQKLNVYY